MPMKWDICWYQMIGNITPISTCEWNVVVVVVAVVAVLGEWWWTCFAMIHTMMMAIRCG